MTDQPDPSEDRDDRDDRDEQDRPFREHAFPVGDLEREVLDICALRVDGYRLMEDIIRERRDPSLGFPEFVAPLVKTRVFHEDDKLNFLVFFGLQRSLGKWEGVYDGPDSDRHIAFRLLFLHLYRMPVPRGYELDDYPRRWEAHFAHRAEEVAALIRRTFTRLEQTPKDWEDVF